MGNKAKKKWTETSVRHNTIQSWSSMHRKWDNYTRGPDHTYYPEPIIPDIFPGLPKKKNVIGDDNILNRLQYIALIERINKLEDMVTKILEKLTELEKEVNPSMVILPIES